MKSSNIGGQAVMEGIMMRHENNYSVAVRKPDQEIEVKVEPYRSIIKSPVLKKTPIVRGVFNFIESLVVGTSCLMYSSSFYEEDEEEREKNEQRDKLLMYGTVIFSMVIAVAVFMMLPYFIAGFLRNITSSEAVIAIAEACIRILLFLGYVLLISQMKDIQRVFMYHGAEHKCINCLEHGMELKVDNVMKSSREHKRCGTSFLLFVMIVSVIFFLFIRVDSPWLRVGVRLLLVPVIAGVSYELIRLAGRSENAVVNLLSKPGMALQRLTTREPDEEMAEVAIAAVEAVFDWREYLRENFDVNQKQEQEDDLS